MNIKKFQNKLTKIHLNELSLEQIEEIKETFYLLDKNQCDKINFRDLKIGMLALGLFPSEEDLERIIKQVKIKSDSIKDSVCVDDFFEIVSFRLVKLKFYLIWLEQ